MTFTAQPRENPADASLEQRAAAEFVSIEGRLAALEGDTPPDPDPDPTPVEDAGLFTAESVWNQPASPAKLRDLYSDELGPLLHDSVEAYHWPNYVGARIYTVAADTPREPVILVGYGDSYDPAVNPPLEHLSGLATVFAQGVPIPDGFAAAAEGGDNLATIICPETGEVWDFYHLAEHEGQWYSVGGGAIKDHRRFHGASYDETAFPPYSTPQWGTRAGGAPVAAGAVLIEEAWRQQRIPHAVAMLTPRTRTGWVDASAQRTDAAGTTDDRTVPAYGQWYRLNLSESEIAGSGYTPLTKIFLTAMAEFGFRVVDRTQSYGLLMEDGVDDYARRGASVFSEVVEDLPPLFRTSDTPRADGTYAIASYSGSHFNNMWANDRSQVQLLRRFLTWPARSSDGAY